MACNTCQATKSIPVCADSLILGEIAPDTEVYIFVVNHSSGYTSRQEAISDNAGILKADLTKPDPSFYNPDSNYELWTTTSQSDRLDITIDSVAYSCFNLSFNTLYEDDTNVSYDEITLEIL